MSLLSQQISQLRRSQGKDTSGSSVPSILFSEKDASEIDAVSLLEVAQNALSELQRHDARFAEFSTSLFHSSSTSVDRTLLSPQESAALDSKLSTFLLLLSPSFSTKPAFRVTNQPYPFCLVTQTPQPHYLTSNSRCLEPGTTLKTNR